MLISLIPQMTFDIAEGRHKINMASGSRNTLGTLDIVVLVVYFLLVLAVGFWVSTRGKKLSNTFTEHFYTP